MSCEPLFSCLTDWFDKTSQKRTTNLCIFERNCEALFMLSSAIFDYLHVTFLQKMCQKSMFPDWLSDFWPFKLMMSQFYNVLSYISRSVKCSRLDGRSNLSEMHILQFILHHPSSSIWESTSLLFCKIDTDGCMAMFCTDWFQCLLASAVQE